MGCFLSADVESGNLSGLHQMHDVRHRAVEEDRSPERATPQPVQMHNVNIVQLGRGVALEEPLMMVAVRNADAGAVCPTLSSYAY